MMAAKDAREFLQVPENATMQQLADAFRRVALSAHPDAGGSEKAFRRCVGALRLAAGAAAVEAPQRAAPAALPVALGRLERALRSVERPERREALEQMPQKVRFALHHHMLSSEAATATTEKSMPCTLPPTRGTGSSCLERRVVGVASRCEYRVRQSLGRIEVRTEYVSCLGRALHFLALLVQLQALLSPSAFTVEAYCRAFHLAWSRRTDDGETAPVQLAFRATVCCCAVKLQGPYTDQLQVALEQHLQLREAYVRGGWLRLHRAFQKLTGAEFTKVSHAQLRGQLWRAVHAVERALRGTGPRGGRGPWTRRKVKRLDTWRK